MHVVEKFMMRLSKSTIRKAAKQERARKVSKELKVLLVGYSGKRNTGAEVRCAEIIKQIKTMNLPFKPRFGVLTLDPKASKDYYTDDVDMIPMSSLFFKPLLEQCLNYDAAILAEGSCLTSVTSNIAALYFITAAALMKAQGKPCLAYGVEAGPMPKPLVKLARKHADETYFIARTETSRKRFQQYGLQTTLGTDTAWTVVPSDPSWAQAELGKKLGMENATKQTVGISPMNAYIRPIYPSFSKYVRSLLTKNWNYNYDKFYYYTTDTERKRNYQRYIRAIAVSINALQKQGIVPVMIEMEPMDRDCIKDIMRLCSGDFCVLSADDYNAEEMTALLIELDLLITSRYHAHVLAMHGGVPTIALSKDQRLHTIFDEHELSAYCISTQDEDIEAKLLEAVKAILPKREFIKEHLLERLDVYKMEQAQMGALVEEYFNKQMA